MCGRYVLVQKIEVLEKRYNATFADPETYVPSYNIGAGHRSPVITSDNPREIRMLRFGLSPFWAKKKMLLLNARSEGDHNPDDNPSYSGAKGILQKPAFRKAIRSQRCLVPADAFIEGTTTEGLSKPFLVYLRDQVRPFSLAGIWDTWTDPETGEITESFAIITTTANELLQKIPHHRSPVILNPGDEKKWLDPNRALSDITSLLKPFPAEKMNAFPITPEIKSPRAQGSHLIQPAGERLMPETVAQLSKEIKLQGMGQYKARK
jgi:putative SOS response-associated peptidase YedK